MEFGDVGGPVEARPAFELDESRHLLGEHLVEKVVGYHNEVGSRLRGDQEPPFRKHAAEIDRLIGKHKTAVERLRGLPEDLGSLPERAALTLEIDRLEARIDSLARFDRDPEEVSTRLERALAAIDVAPEEADGPMVEIVNAVAHLKERDDLTSRASEALKALGKLSGTSAERKAGGLLRKDLVERVDHAESRLRNMPSRDALNRIVYKNSHKLTENEIRALPKPVCNVVQEVRADVARAGTKSRNLLRRLSALSGEKTGPGGERRRLEQIGAILKDMTQLRKGLPGFLVKKAAVLGVLALPLPPPVNFVLAAGKAVVVLAKAVDRGTEPGGRSF